MTDFSAIDPNFRVESTFEEDGLAFFDASKPPFSLHGLLQEEGCFRRLPFPVAQATSEEVALLSLHPAGGRVRFWQTCGWTMCPCPWWTAWATSS